MSPVSPWPDVCLVVIHPELFPKLLPIHGLSRAATLHGMQVEVNRDS